MKTTHHNPVAVTGIAVASCLGNTPLEHQIALDAGRSGLRPMRELPEFNDSLTAFENLPAGWIAPREMLSGRRYGPTSNLCLHLARTAIADAKISSDELKSAWLFCGSSRGNAAGWLSQWPHRNPKAIMATSNTMHSELAAAISIELGVRGPYNVLTNGCASGLDALGWGYFTVASGLAPRVLVVSADLPLVPTLLSSFAQTGLMSRNNRNDPYSPDTTGFLPGEGGAAFVLEDASISRESYGAIHGYWATSDAYDPLGLPADGCGIAECLQLALEDLKDEKIAAICPHASGTLAHGQAERYALQSVFGKRSAPLSLHLMKPFTGHTLGASGAIDAAILLHYMKQNLLPPNLQNLSGRDEIFSLPSQSVSIEENAMILKISVGMGGHNAVLALLRRAEQSA